MLGQTLVQLAACPVCVFQICPVLKRPYDISRPLKNVVLGRTDLKLTLHLCSYRGQVADLCCSETNIVSRMTRSIQEILRYLFRTVRNHCYQGPSSKPICLRKRLILWTRNKKGITIKLFGRACVYNGIGVDFDSASSAQAAFSPLIVCFCILQFYVECCQQRRARKNQLAMRRRVFQVLKVLC